MEPVSLISLEPAAEDERASLEHLVQLYCYDWSELLTDFHAGEDGRFPGIALAPYWNEEGRHALVLRVDAKLAGFALVGGVSRLSGTRGVFDMAEFFVMRGFRRRGVGLAAAFAAFDRFKGPWEVRQRDENAAATSFWRRAIGAYTGGNYREVRWTGPEWNGLVQSFATST